MNEEKYEVNKESHLWELYRVHYKLDTLCFYLDKYMLFGTKDQSIRVVPY